MARLVPWVLAVLAASMVVSAVGIALFLYLRPCPIVPLDAGPQVVVVCDWWDITCLKCNA